MLNSTLTTELEKFFGPKWRLTQDGGGVLWISAPVKYTGREVELLEEVCSVVLDTRLVRDELELKDAEIRGLKKELEILETYKIHYDMSYKLKHG